MDGGRGESEAEERRRTARPRARLVTIMSKMIDLMRDAQTDCSRTASAGCFLGGEFRRSVT